MTKLSNKKIEKFFVSVETKFNRIGYCQVLKLIITSSPNNKTDFLMMSGLFTFLA